VSEALGLPGQPFHSAQILTSKTQFREFLAAHHLPMPRSFPVQVGFQPAPGIFSRGAWILKPDRSSGCKGTFILRSESEFRQRLPETLAFSTNHQAVVEEFIVRHQGTCEGVMRAGRIALSFVLDRQTASAPYATTVGHHCPSTLPEAAQERLRGLIERVFEELSIREAVFDCDFVASSEDVFLLEITPRAGGNSISGLLRLAAGFDVMEYAVREACGEDPQLPTSVALRPTALLLLGVWEPGELRYDQSELEKLRRESWVESIALDLLPGTPVLPFTNGRHRAGEAIIYGKDRLDLDAKAAALRQRLNVCAA
jgi:biotin carboxylase